MNLLSPLWPENCLIRQLSSLTNSALSVVITNEREVQGGLVCIVLYYELVISKALRYGTC